MKVITKNDSETISESEVRGLPFALVLGERCGSLITIKRACFKGGFRVAVVTDFISLREGNGYVNSNEDYFKSFEEAFDFMKDLSNIELYYFDNLSEYYTYLASYCE